MSKRSTSIVQSYVGSTDPSDMASPLPTPDVLYERAESAHLGVEEEETVQVLPTMEQIAHLLDRLPDREADLLYLYFIKGKRQAEIAAIFEVTQAAISYRIDRALYRIKFLLAIPNLDVGTMRVELPAHFDALDIEILVGMWLTTCQSEVAKRLKETQGRVRHRFFAAVELLATLKDSHPKMVKYHKVFAAIGNKGFNVARSVQLPQWSKRGQDKCG